MRVLQVPALQNNYFYFIICDQTGEAAIVDSPDASLTRSIAKKEGFNLTTILNTHHHWDHIGANEDLLSNPIGAAVLQKLNVYGFERDRERIPGLTHAVREGDVVKIGNVSLRVMEIPGHTSGHIAYVTDGAVFSGDTIFVAGCGRLFEGTPAQMHTSLQKLQALPDETLVYGAHEYSLKNLEFALTIEPGNPNLIAKYNDVVSMRKKDIATVPTTLGEEKSYNPFLREHSLEIIENLRRMKLLESDHPVEVFAAIRKLKDVY